MSIEKLRDALKAGILIDTALHISGINVKELDIFVQCQLLYLAALSHEREFLVDLLLDAGIPIHSTHTEEGSCVRELCIVNNVSALETLLARGADPNYYTENEGSLLYTAARFGRLEAIELLLKYGAKDRADKDGVTANHALKKYAGFNGVQKTLTALNEQTVAQ